MEAGLNRTKPLDELQEQKATLERQIDEDKRVIADENTSPSERENRGSSCCRTGRRAGKVGSTNSTKGRSSSFAREA